MALFPRKRSKSVLVPKTPEEAIAAIRTYISKYPKRSGPTWDAIVMRVDDAKTQPYSSTDPSTGYEVDADLVAIKSFSLKCFILDDAQTVWFPIDWLIEPSKFDLLPSFNGSIYYNAATTMPQEYDIVEVQLDTTPFAATSDHQSGFDPRLSKGLDVLKQQAEASLSPRSTGAMNHMLQGKFIKTTGRDVFNLLSRAQMVPVSEQFHQNKGNNPTIGETIARLTRSTSILEWDKMANECAKRWMRQEWGNSAPARELLARFGEYPFWEENEEKIGELHASLHPLVRCFLYRSFTEAGVVFQITSGYRTVKQQNSLRKRWIQHDPSQTAVAAMGFTTGAPFVVNVGSGSPPYASAKPPGLSLNGEGYIDGHPDPRGLRYATKSGGSWHNLGAAFDVKGWRLENNDVITAGSSVGKFVGAGLAQTSPRANWQSGPGAAAVSIAGETGLLWGGKETAGQWDPIRFFVKLFDTPPYKVLQYAKTQTPPLAENRVPLNSPIQ